MSSDDGLLAGFEAARGHLRGVAFRMLGSFDDAEDAVQLAWLRAEQADLRDVENVAGWLTTVTARVCLDMLRARRRRDERSLVAAHAGALGVTGDGSGPGDDVMLAESVGLALLVVLDRLSPAQRVAFVMHDLFAVPFDEVAIAVDRSPAAAKKLASRARERVRGGGTTAGDQEQAEHQAVVEAFLTAAQGGDLDTLLDLLAPDVVRRADRVAAPSSTASAIRGARAVADETEQFAARARDAEVALVDGSPGIVIAPLGRLFAVLRVRVVGSRITELDVIADAERLDEITIAVTTSAAPRSSSGA